MQSCRLLAIQTQQLKITPIFVIYPLSNSPRPAIINNIKNRPNNNSYTIIFISAKMIIEQQLTEAQLQQVYNWVDEVPLSRPKRNMSRDFSDAVLFAEIVEYYNPKIIQLHNYNATGALPQKFANWNTLNRKVLPKLKLTLKAEQIQNLCNSAPGAIQKLIYRLKKVIEKGDLISPSVVSKTSKTNTSLSFGLESDNKPKKYHKMPYSEIKKQKDVHELTSAKDQQINMLKSQISLLLLKSSKLEEMLKSKDRQIEEIVTLIRNNKK